MIRLVFAIVLIVVAHAKSWSLTHHSINHGVWDDVNIWSTNQIPQDGDSIFVHHEVVYGGTDLTLTNVHLEITETGCLCGPEAQLVLHESTLINDGHLAFIKLEVHNNTTGTSAGTLLLTEYVLATSNSSMTITSGGIHITQENDLTCTCFDSTRYDSLVALIDEDDISSFTFQYYFDLNSDTMQFCEGEEISLHYDKEVTYYWSDGSTGNSINPENEKWLILEMTQKGDTVIDSIYVQKFEVYKEPFPNIYTPNNDGINDYIIISKSHLVDFDLYNRWGKNVIKYKGWGLELNNFNLSDGDYFYLLNVETKCSDKQIEQKGWLQILR